jgi:hypothetical protein
MDLQEQSETCGEDWQLTSASLVNELVATKSSAVHPHIKLTLRESRFTFGPGGQTLALAMAIWDLV